MPRPETCVTLDAVENPGWKMHPIELRVAGLRIRGDPALRHGLRPDLLEIESRPVVGQLDRDFVRDLPHGKRDFAGLGFARLDSLGAGLDAVVERVAQEMVERPDELFQHRAVELGLAAADFEIGALAELARRPPQDPVQALRQAAERHGANGEQLLLDTAREPALRAQRGIGDVEVLEERLLDRRNVVDTLAQRARQLLEARVPIELERIKSFLTLADLHQARLDLRLGLDLDLAHLSAQAYHAAGELEQVRLECLELAFDPRPGDRHFAGFVDQPIDDVGANAQHRPRAALAVDHLRRHARWSMVGSRQRYHDGAFRGSGSRRFLGSRARFPACGHLVPVCPRHGDVGPASTQRAEHERDTVEVPFERLEQIGRTGHRRIVDIETRLHQVHELAQAHRACHARAALEGVEGSPKLARPRVVARRAAPGAHALARLRIELRCLLEKYRQDLCVDVVANVGERILGYLTACGVGAESRRSGRHN